MPHPSHDTPNEPQEQLWELLNRQWEQEIVPLLPADSQPAACRLGAFQRQRKVRCVADLLRALLAYVLCASSLRQLGAWAVLIGLANLSHVAWQKRLQHARSWLLWLLTELLAVPAAQEPSQQRRILLIDATRLKEPGGCGDDWRLHTAYDLLHARLLDMHVSDQHTAEGFTLFAWHPGDLLVADRGYCNRPQLAWALAQHADVVVRLKPFPLCSANGLPFDLVQWLRDKPAGRYECQVSFVHGQQRFQGRLIAQSLSEEEAERARAKLRRKASKKQHALKEDTWLLAGWFLVFTSLPQESWSAEKVLRLYRARWQVELLFKRMKQVLKLGHVRGTTPQSNEATIFALLVAWALQQRQVDEARQLIAQARAVLEAEQHMAAQALTVSSWALHTMSIQTLRISVQGFWSQARLRLYWPCLLRFVCSRRKRREHQESGMRHLLCSHFGWDASSLFRCSSA